MKIDSKRIISLLMLMVILISNIAPNIALAIDGTPNISVTVSSATLQRGETFTATVEFDNNGSNDCIGISYALQFDSNVLEVINVPNDQIMTTGAPTVSDANTANNLGEVRFLWYSPSVIPLQYAGKMFEVQFKVKENAVGGRVNLNLIPTMGNAYITDYDDNDVAANITNSKIDVVVPLEAIDMSKDSLQIKEGESAKLDVIYTPADTTQKKINWTSSDNSVATVSADGTVTGVKRGEAVITATTAEGNKTATCNVKITREIGSIVLDKSNLSLDKGETAKLTATLPTDVDGDRNITWTSSNTAVATVDSEGNVTAVEKGNAVITATTANGKSATCNVEVRIKLQSISFDGNITEKTFQLGKEAETEINLNVVYNPSNTDADKTQLTWTSTDTSVATVENGKVTAKGQGDAVITASLEGKTATCNIHVRVPILSISTKDKTTLTYGEEEKLDITYETYNKMDTTEDKTIKWESSDTNIVQVSTDGTITTKGPGKATITATSLANPNLTTTCEVTVLPIPLQSLIIEQQSVVIEKGETKKLTVKFNPENTTDSKNITWESSDTNIAVIDTTGVVTAMKNGKVTITAKTNNGMKATTEVTVVTLLKDIKLNETDVTINKDVPLTLKVTLDPVDATLDDATVRWSSSNTEVATVNSNGEVTTHKAGTAFIYATVGGITKECKLTVNVPLTGLKIDEKITLLKGQEKILNVIKEPEGTNFNGKITFTSSDTSHATVDKEGKIEALSATEEGIPVIITVNAIEKDVMIASTTCEVTVIEIPLDSIAISQSDFSLGLGRSQKLKVLYNPDITTDDRTVIWTSSNSDIVSVTSDGTVTAKSLGEALITANVNGKYAEVLITTHEIPITALKVYTNLSNNKLALGKAITLTVKAVPEDATRQGNYKFTSSDERILTVDEKGNVIAHSVGRTLITVEAENGVKEQVEIEVVKDNIAAAEEYKRLSPKTGDIKIELYASIMIISALGIVIILATSKHHKK